MGKYSVHKEHLKVGAFRWWYVPLVYVLVSVWSVAFPMVVEMLGMHFLKGAWLAVVQFAGYAALTIAIIWAFQRRVFCSDVGLVLERVGSLCLVVFALFVLLEVGVYVFERLSAAGADASEKVLSSLGFGESSYNDVAIVLGVAVMAPIGEEFVYRGLMFKSLRDSLARWLPLHYTFYIAAFVSAALFAASHGSPDQATQLGMLFFMGVLFALSYEWTGSLFAPVLLHSLNNVYALLQGVLQHQGVAPIGWPAIVLAVVSPLLAFAILYVLMRVLPQKKIGI